MIVTVPGIILVHSNSNGKDVDNTVVLTIVSLKYTVTVPVEYSALVKYTYRTVLACKYSSSTSTSSVRRCCVPLVPGVMAPWCFD